MSCNTRDRVALVSWRPAVDGLEWQQHGARAGYRLWFTYAAARVVNRVTQMPEVKTMTEQGVTFDCAPENAERTGDTKID